MNDKTSVYTRAARWIAQLSGRPVTFLLAVASIILWLVTGPIFGFSDTWQLVINTGTTIVTFLMVFLIQNTQNRDTTAMRRCTSFAARPGRTGRTRACRLRHPIRSPGRQGPGATGQGQARHRHARGHYRDCTA